MVTLLYSMRVEKARRSPAFLKSRASEACAANKRTPNPAELETQESIAPAASTSAGRTGHSE